jgi:hypothetical protein
MAPITARSTAEAHLYMSLRPCPKCGDAKFARTMAVSLEDGVLVNRYVGPCRRCGTMREFRFIIDDGLPPDAAPPDDGDQVFDQTGRPSRIIDPGEWLRSVDRVGHATPTTILGISPEERRSRRFMLRSGAAMVNEVVKFIPEGDDEVPEPAFWTEDGKAMRASSPERFTRAELEKLQLLYLDLADRYA